MSYVDEALLKTEGIQIKDAFVVIVRTSWNSHVVDVLQKGCENILQQHGIKCKVVEVPGAVEIPFMIRYYQENAKEKASAYIALGCVIRGDTPHFDYVCHTVTEGVLQLNLSLPVPVIFGVLTVDSQVQADERTGGRNGHKGEEAAFTAIKMIGLCQSLI